MLTTIHRRQKHRVWLELEQQLDVRFVHGEIQGRLLTVVEEEVGGAGSVLLEKVHLGRIAQ